MKQSALIMGMPITIEIVGFADAEKAIADTFDYFRSIDERFSTYKPDSEISQINRVLPEAEWSREMKLVMKLCEQTKRETRGYFDIRRNGKLDPSGLVKGWAINEAAKILRKRGAENFYIEAGGDIQVGGRNSKAEPWKIGIRNPFDRNEIIKIISVKSEGVATSGTYIRGQHIYNPLLQDSPVQDSPARDCPDKSARGRTSSVSEIKSLTVIGPDIYEADRFATAAFAMGLDGIEFIGSLPGFEGYMIDNSKTATFTRGFERYVVDAQSA